MSKLNPLANPLTKEFVESGYRDQDILDAGTVSDAEFRTTIMKAITGGRRLVIAAGGKVEGIATCDLDALRLNRADEIAREQLSFPEPGGVE